MHARFVDKWCERYDKIWDSKGEAEALGFLKKKLSGDQFALVRKRFPFYAKEQREKKKNG